MKKAQLTLFLSNAVLVAFAQQERPNILLLTIEDTSWYEFAAYGNKCVETPNIDQLAQEGIVFRHAYSNSPQSSPARSGLITGTYASTYAMEQHRSSLVTPSDIFYPQLLRAAGYFCTNNQKTDYNTTIDNKSFWNECDGKASYNSSSRGEAQPFFAIYNAGITHMGRIRSFHTDERRDFTLDNILIDNAPLPAHLPDLPEVRSDYAFHLEGVKDVDKWVGIFIRDLKARGLYDNTIIFFFSDHGGCSPRGKGYLYETGLRVPMVVRVPEQYKDEFGISPETGSKPVGFVDLAPTFMQIAGVESPAHYQGESFFRPLDAGETKYMYGVCGNQASHYQPLRSVSDGRYKYIRRYIPYKQHALRNYYQWGMPANIAWDLAYQEGRTNSITSYPFESKVAEELFDLSVDSFEINNLAYLPDYAAITATMRTKIDDFVVNTNDLGFVTRSQRNKQNIYERCHAVNYPLQQLHRLANLTCKVEVSDLPELETALTSSYPEIRFWAVVNIAQLAVQGKITTAPTGFDNLLNDTNLEVAAETAYALCYLNQPVDGMNYFMKVVRSKSDYQEALSLMEVLSLDQQAKSFYTPAIITELKNYTSISNYGNQTNIGFLVRGVLVNLNEYPANQVFDSPVYNEGLQVNKDRRSLTPVPGGVSAYTPFFLENFSPVTGQSSIPLTSLEDKTDVAGWLSSTTGIFAQNSSQLGGGLRISSSATTLAWAETPELDLAKPVVLEFYSKKWQSASEGTLYVDIEGDTILTVINPNQTIAPRKSEAFVSGANSRIRFSVKKVDANHVCIDSIRVSETDESALSLPLSKKINMGKTLPGSVLTYSLPVRVYNGTALLNFSFPESSLFDMDGGEYVIELEEMTNTGNAVFVFNAPEAEGEYMVKVEVDCGTDFAKRVIWLNATVEEPSGVDDVQFGDIQVVVDKRIIRIKGKDWSEARLYTLNGQMHDFVLQQAVSTDMKVPDQGVFLLRISGSKGVTTKKLIIR